MGRSASNRVVHLELHTGNLARACLFYLIWRLNLSWPKTGSMVIWRWR
jgi:hypothetical protein